MDVPQQYWTHFGRRAVQVYKKLLPRTPLEVMKCNGPCRDLTDTSHFHVDLFVNYIPGLCSGLSVQIDDLVGALDGDKYPMITMYGLIP